MENECKCFDKGYGEGYTTGYVHGTKDTAKKILNDLAYCNDHSFYLTWCKLCEQYGITTDANESF